MLRPQCYRPLLLPPPMLLLLAAWPVAVSPVRIRPGRARMMNQLAGNRPRYGHDHTSPAAIKAAG